MNKPKIKLMAISNVFTRLMHFEKKGDVEIGHAHYYDHATLISTGSILYELLDSKNGTTLASKKFNSPEFIFVEKEKFHRLTALEDNTVCVCIHALRSIDETIIPSDALISTVQANEIFNKGEINNAVEKTTNLKMKVFVKQK